MAKANPGPFLWSGLIYVVCLALAFLAAWREKAAISSGEFPVPPEIIGTPPEKAGLPLLYFFALVLALGLILFLIPLSKLRLVLGIVFGFTFSWGAFIVLWLFSVPAWAALGLAAIGGLAWLLRPSILLHNAMLALTLVGMASIFGVIFAPWTVILFMFVISVYDYLSVRFGYMQWMSRKLSQSDTLPAFFIPRELGLWSSSVTGPTLKNIFDDAAAREVSHAGPGEKEFSVLGGGDIGFPLLLAVSVMYVYGIGKGLTVAAFSLLGLFCAYLVHLLVMKGRPTPALPPVFLSSLAGFLLVRYVL